MGIDRYFHVKQRRFLRFNLKPRYAVIKSVMIILVTLVINSNLLFTIQSNLPESSPVACNKHETVVMWQKVIK